MTILLDIQHFLFSSIFLFSKGFQSLLSDKSLGFKSPKHDPVLINYPSLMIPPPPNITFPQQNYFSLTALKITLSLLLHTQKALATISSNITCVDYPGLLTWYFPGKFKIRCEGKFVCL
jgi:hypothetical protein